MTPQHIKEEAWSAAETKCGDEVTPYRSGYFYGYIAGATAEHSRAQSEVYELVLALEAIIKSGENIRATYKTSKPPFYINVARAALAKWKGEPKEGINNEAPPDLGQCKECNKRPAVKDYNGHKYFVCQLCYDSLNREFDEEYH